MKTKLLTAVLLASLAPSIWAVNITAIMGNGIQADNWTDNQANGIQLALRAKYRGDAVFGADAYQVPAPTGSTYSFSAGNVGARGPFNYEFSINSDTAMLDAYDYYLSVDHDSSAGISYTTVLPLFHWGDNSYGNAGTAQSAGVEPANMADYLAFPGIYSIAQNSQNITFGDYPGGALPLVADATYNYELFAVSKGAGASGAKLADVGITVVVGNGGATVPEAGNTLALLGLGVVGLVGFSYRKQMLAA